QIGVELMWMQKMTDKFEEFKNKAKSAEDDPLIDSLIEQAKQADENTDYYEAVKILKYEIVKRLENKRKYIWWGSFKLPFLFLIAPAGNPFKSAVFLLKNITACKWALPFKMQKFLQKKSLHINGHSFSIS